MNQLTQQNQNDRKQANPQHDDPVARGIFKKEIN
jgi:hypothetical protein